jgi:hypothetical protein
MDLFVVAEDFQDGKGASVVLLSASWSPVPGWFIVWDICERGRPPFSLGFAVLSGFVWAFSLPRPGLNEDGGSFNTAVPALGFRYSNPNTTVQGMMGQFWILESGFGAEIP